MVQKTKAKETNNKQSKQKRYKILAGNGCHQAIADEMAFDFLGSAVNFILDHSREAQSDLK